MTKEEKCELLHLFYGWSLNDLLKNNEAQIDVLYAACLNQNGNLRTAVHI